MLDSKESLAKSISEAEIDDIKKAIDFANSFQQANVERIKTEVKDFTPFEWQAYIATLRSGINFVNQLYSQSRVDKKKEFEGAGFLPKAKKKKTASKKRTTKRDKIIAMYTKTMGEEKAREYVKELGL